MGWLVNPKTYKNEGGHYVFYRRELDGSKYDSDSFDIGNRDAWRRELERYHRSPEGLKLGELASMRGLVIAYEVYGFGRVGGTNKLRHALFPQVFYEGTEKHFFRKYGILSVYDRQVRGTKRVSFE